MVKKVAPPILATLALLGPQGMLRAQVPEDLPEVAPVSVGSAQLYPLYRADFGWTDNLFYEPTDQTPVSTSTATLSPGFVLDLPFSQSHARLGYVLHYRDYQTSGIPADTGHFFVGDARLGFSNKLVVHLRDDFQRGVLDTEVFAPGGEITFRGDRFQANTARVDLSRERKTPGGLLLTVSHYTLRFLERRSGYFDVDEDTGDLSGEHALGPRFRALWEIAYSRSSLSRPDGDDFTAEDRTEVEESVKAGGIWALSQGSWVTIKAGHQRNDTRSDRPTRSGNLVGYVHFQRGVPAGAQFNVTLTRDVYPSVFLANNTYLINRLSLQLTNDPGARLVLGGRTAYHTSDYPIAVDVEPGHVDAPYQGRKRWDHTLDGEVWVGYRFSSFLVGRIFVRSSRRDSLIPRFEYDVNSIGVNLSIGG